MQKVSGYETQWLQMDHYGIQLSLLVLIQALHAAVFPSLRS